MKLRFPIINIFDIKDKTEKNRIRPFLMHEIQGRTKNREIQNQTLLTLCNTGKNQKQGRRESDLSWCMKYREKTKTGMTRTRPFLVHEIQGRTKTGKNQKQGRPEPDLS